MCFRLMLFVANALRLKRHCLLNRGKLPFRN
jgi:hypothetical protein